MVFFTLHLMKIIYKKVFINRISRSSLYEWGSILRYSLLLNRGKSGERGGGGKSAELGILLYGLKVRAILLGSNRLKWLFEGKKIRSRNQQWQCWQKMPKDEDEYWWGKSAKETVHALANTNGLAHTHTIRLGAWKDAMVAAHVPPEHMRQSTSCTLRTRARVPVHRRGAASARIAHCRIHSARTALLLTGVPGAAHGHTRIGCAQCCLPSTSPPVPGCQRACCPGLRPCSHHTLADDRKHSASNAHVLPVPSPCRWSTDRR
jgi:hypothetical protein